MTTGKPLSTLVLETSFFINSLFTFVSFKGSDRKTHEEKLKCQQRTFLYCIMNFLG